ncbi:MAG: peptide chain release factor N(5)-glutamine methyltransferase [Nitrospirae bacterium]|nr:peptide chain release factor N(5)-glutamine methyltransferase [Nitrospirota bacterium]
MATKSWRLVDALKWGSGYLEEQGIEMSLLESQLLLGHVLNRGQSYLYLNFEEFLSAESLSSFRNLIERRKERIPWQYLTGQAEFMSGDFLVNEKVLIPRPETEILVEAALKKIKSWHAIQSQFLTPNSYFPIIDIGTGCGNIAITLSKTLPCQVYALDISESALQVARENAQRLGSGQEITFLQGDMFALGRPGPGAIFRGLEGKVDLLISNPPYVSTSELDSLQPEVSCFEPRAALDGGEDGLKFYPPLIEGAVTFLRPGGYLALEMGINQAKVVEQLIIEKNRFHYPEIIKDYSGIERVIIARKR